MQRKVSSKKSIILLLCVVQVQSVVTNAEVDPGFIYTSMTRRKKMDHDSTRIEITIQAAFTQALNQIRSGL